MVTNIEGYRLSPQQERSWSLGSADEAASLQGLVVVAGDLDAERLRAAWRIVAARHGILRTGFHRRAGFKSVLQVVADEVVAPEVEEVDLGTAPDGERRQRMEQVLDEARRAPWEWMNPPLARLHLVRWNGDDEGPRRLLAVTLPALCADGRTLDNLVGELARAAAGEALDTEEEPPVQYLELSEWQHSLREDEDAEEGADWWRQRRAPAATLGPLPRSAEADGTGFAAVTVPASATPPVGDAQDADAWLAAWLTLLLRLGAEGERRAGIEVGVVVDGRRYEELVPVLGPGSRVLPVSLEIDVDEPFASLVERVAAQREEVSAWQDHHRPEDGAVADYGFEYRAGGAAAGGGGALRLVGQRGMVEPVGLGLVCFENGAGSGGSDGVTAQLHYDRSRYGRGDVERWATQLATLLAGLVPEEAVGAPSLLDGAERRRLVEAWNDTAMPFPAERCAHELFAEQAAATPGATALAWDGGRLDYRGLDRAANALALRLREAGVGVDTPVALTGGRTPEAVVAMLAVLKAGGAFAPLDPQQPAERLAALVAELGSPVVLGSGDAAPPLPPGPPTISLDGVLEAEGAASPPPPVASPDSLAYVLYTSGSTGRPKGVMVPHRGLVSYLEWCRRSYGLAGGTGAPVHSALSFDLTLTSLLAPLVTGGCARLVREEQGVEALAEALAEERFELLKLTPAHLELLAARTTGDAPLRGAGTLVVGGEALRGEALADWRRAFPDDRVINEYGPTETVVGCTVHELPAGTAPAAGAVPIGRPIGNARVYLLDRRLQPVAVGETGQIWIGGVGLARGYLGRPAETAVSFRPDPFSPEGGGRLYRSGDLARFRGDADLEFLGRADHQLKVRGYRIEPGEVESALESHDGVGRAVVVARDGRLLAYLVPDGGGRAKVEELRRFVAARLPEYMVPAAFTWLDTLPLTAHGKVDRRALPEPELDRTQLEREFVPPRTPVEEILCAIWAEVLGVDQVGIHDSFFTLGGDSIRSVRVVALARERGLELTVQDLFRRPDVASLAAELDERLGLTPGPDAEGDELAELLDEVEGLSEETVQARLRELLAAEQG